MLDRLETELKIRGFSNKTVSSYLYHNKNFVNFIGKEPSSVNEFDAKNTSLTCFLTENTAPGAQISP